MDLTGGIAPAITDAITTLKAAIPADITAAHDALADLESKLLAGAQADVQADIDKLAAAGQKLLGADSLAVAVQKLLGAPDLLSVGRSLIAALVIGKQLELYAPAGPFVIRLGDAPKGGE
jgi:hypothetical protein